MTCQLNMGASYLQGAKEAEASLAGGVGVGFATSMAPQSLAYGEARMIRLGGPMVSAHLLVDREGLTLIDAGLWGVSRELRRAVAELKRRPEELRDIVLAHGHRDLVGGAAEIQEWSGARVWVHAAVREHVVQRVK